MAATLIEVIIKNLIVIVVDSPILSDIVILFLSGLVLPSLCGFFSGGFLV